MAPTQRVKVNSDNFINPDSLSGGHEPKSVTGTVTTGQKKDKGEKKVLNKSKLLLLSTFLKSGSQMFECIKKGYCW